MTTPPAPSSLTLREATLDDAIPAARLGRSLGLHLPESDGAAHAHWARFWRDNPALAAGLHAVFIPHGDTWILEHEEVNPAPSNQKLLIVGCFAELREHF